MLSVKTTAQVTSRAYSLQTFLSVSDVAPTKQNWGFNSGRSLLSEKATHWESGSDWLWGLMWRESLQGLGEAGPVPFSSSGELSWPTGLLTPDLWAETSRTSFSVAVIVAAFVYLQRGCFETLLISNADLYGNFSSWNSRWVFGCFWKSELKARPLPPAAWV